MLEKIRKAVVFKCLLDVAKHVTIPIEWEYMKRKSIYKGKGNKKEMNNQRVIFITNILSKFRRE